MGADTSTNSTLTASIFSHSDPLSHLCPAPNEYQRILRCAWSLTLIGTSIILGPAPSSACMLHGGCNMSVYSSTQRITEELAEGSKTTVIGLRKSHTIERHMVWSLVGLADWGWFQQKWFHLAITGVPVLPRSCDCDSCGLKRCCLQTSSRRNWVHWSNYFVSSK